MMHRGQAAWGLNAYVAPMRAGDE